jgi:transposase
MQYMRAQIDRAGTPGPRAIGIDEISIRKGHNYRIVVSDLVRKRPIWFGGDDRSEASMAQFYAWLRHKKASKTRLIVMDMWKPFRNVARNEAPQAAILYQPPLTLTLSPPDSQGRESTIRCLLGGDSPRRRIG